MKSRYNKKLTVTLVGGVPSIFDGKSIGWNQLVFKHLKLKQKTKHTEFTQKLRNDGMTWMFCYKLSKEKKSDVQDDDDRDDNRRRSKFDDDEDGHKDRERGTKFGVEGSVSKGIGNDHLKTFFRSPYINAQATLSPSVSFSVQAIVPWTGVCENRFEYDWKHSSVTGKWHAEFDQMPWKSSFNMSTSCNYQFNGKLPLLSNIMTLKSSPPFLQSIGDTSVSFKT